ncbi:hypothetical protein GCM10010350_81160 [Streptomyces galilaeus]|nr:hypothetical protein GCM10010350_81160 [Streptomyces galilaeus]
MRAVPRKAPCRPREDSRPDQRVIKTFGTAQSPSPLLFSPLPTQRRPDDNGTGPRGHKASTRLHTLSSPGQAEQQASGNDGTQPVRTGENRPSLPAILPGILKDGLRLPGHGNGPAGSRSR